MEASKPAIERWKLLNFRQIQTELDSSASDIAARQGDSDLSRKHLIDLSRDFRQNSTDEVRKLVNPLLKSFQAEVDNLLKRNKAVEAAFLHIYKTFTDLPDPSSLIDYLGDLEARAGEIQRLRATCEDYGKQLTVNKNQELAEQESKLNALVDERVKRVKHELLLEFADKELEWNLKRQSMERQVQDAEEQSGILRRELDRSQGELSRSRMIINGQSDHEKIAMFAEDLDRANERASSAELQIGDLQQQLSTLHKQIKDRSSLSSESPVVESTSSRSNAQNQDAVQRLHDEFDRMKESYQRQLDRMEDQLARLSSQNALLSRKLENQRDYEELKQELSLLKSAHYAEDLNNGSVESVLVNRNRRLEYENSGLRVRESELSGHQKLRPNGHSLNSGGSCSDVETSPEEDDLSDDYFAEIDAATLTPEMLSKINEAKVVLQNLHARATTGSSGRFVNTVEAVEQVNRVLEEEGITRSALAKFVLYGPYKMVYDALHDPRPWSFLNAVGRDKYRKLKMWAEDSRAINAVKILQVYCKDKQRRGNGLSEPRDEPEIFPRRFSMPQLLLEEPTDLSIPKTTSRRKAFIPQRESSNNTILDSHPMADSMASWFPRIAAGYSALHSSASSPSFIPHLQQQQRRASLFSNNGGFGLDNYHGKDDDSHSPKTNQTLPMSSKRSSPQHSVPRRYSRDNGAPAQVSSIASASVSSTFRPSASFTASPVALGIAFPDYRKNVLHSITDDMINQYDPLDADQVTRHVRTKLNKCNVSQRLFGEVVLGMSQGAVSDLLKRPKPWNKLTRPTKEHYVRMQQFLEDDNSIPVLQAIQNREDPERILASMAEEEEEKPADTWKTDGSSPHSSGSGTLQINHPPTPPPIELPPPPPPRVISESELSEREAFQAVKEHFAKFYQISDVSRGAMCDTVGVSSRIKEELRSRNLQQKLIGELVLDVGQGTVSELLNKPKPFNMLSMKGRENYMKLLKLLQTPEDFTLLEALRSQGQAKANASKRSRSGELENGEKRFKADDGDLVTDSENYFGNHEEESEKKFSKYSDEELNSDEDGEIINGVCVSKSPIRARSEKDTVIVQPGRSFPAKESWMPGKFGKFEKEW